jgi:hypothetical protein
LTSGVPFAVVNGLVVHAIGGVGSWIWLLIFFPLAAWGISRLVKGSLWCQLAASTLYCINPFVFSRIFVGHIPLLLGYALIPLATASAQTYFRSGTWWIPVPALWWAGLTALSPHFAWIFGVIILAMFVIERPIRMIALARFSLVIGVFFVMSLYILLPHNATNLSVSTGTASDLSVYRTAGDPHLGLFVNVIGLYGFWRLGPQLPKDVVTGWPFLLLAILIVAGAGAVVSIRKGPGAGRDISPTESSDRRLAAGLAVVGIVGLLLALGDQGPTGALFRLSYDHVPFFSVMREPQKFLMLTALAYSVLFGWGIEWLGATLRDVRRTWRVVVLGGVAMALPLAYSATILDGLSGQVGNTVLPSSWQGADSAMGDGQGQILFLPWHLYMTFPFTKRVIANPASAVFRRRVISGDNVEVGDVETESTSPRSQYIDRLLSERGSQGDFGGLVAPLGVRYVVLAKTVDWRAYQWLGDQADLHRLINTPSLEIWSNRAYRGVGHSSTGRRILRTSAVSYEIGPGRPGWVYLDAPYQDGWVLDHEPAVQTRQGTIAFYVRGPRETSATFGPWSAARLGYWLSAATFVALLVLVAVTSLLSRRKARRVAT